MHVKFKKFDLLDKGVLEDNNDGSIFVYNHRAEIILIDREDLSLFMKYLWSVHHTGYLLRCAGCKRNKKSVPFHREISNFPTYFLDHINRIKLDNRKSNLREASAQMNAFNTSIRKNNTLGFVGVIYDKRRGNFYGRTRFKTKSYYSRACKSAKEAFKEYVAMKRLFDNKCLHEVSDK